MEVVLLGMPGAGKGTLAVGLAPLLAVPHVSTGDIFRQAMEEGTPLGERIRRGMDEGRFVDDATVLDVVADRLSRPDCAGGFLLDGFPRTLAQAGAFDARLSVAGRPLDAVVFLDLPEAAVRERLAARRQCRECGSIHGLNRPPAADGSCTCCGGELVLRGDDNPQSVDRRLATYRAETEPIVGFYRDRGLLRTVRADADPAGVLAAARAALGR